MQTWIKSAVNFEKCEILCLQATLGCSRRLFSSTPLYSSYVPSTFCSLQNRNIYMCFIAMLELVLSVRDIIRPAPFFYQCSISIIMKIVCMRKTISANEPTFSVFTFPVCWIDWSVCHPDYLLPLIGSSFHLRQCCRTDVGPKELGSRVHWS